MVRVVFVLDDFSSLCLRLAVVLVTALVDSFSACSCVHRAVLLWFALCLNWMNLFPSVCGMLLCSAGYCIG